MDDEVIATHLKHLDSRLSAVEQILPTLATKEDLGPLATKDDLHELRRYMDVLSEDQRSDIRLIAEHLAFVMSRLEDR